LMNGTQKITSSEASKWDLDRIKIDSRFMIASKLSKLLGFGNRTHIFTKFPRLFRYVADDEDKTWLFERNFSTRISGKVFLILIEDALEICNFENATHQIMSELQQRFSFNVSEKMLQKIHRFMIGPSEQLKQRVIVIESPNKEQKHFYLPLSGFFPSLNA